MNMRFLPIYLSLLLCLILPSSGSAGAEAVDNVRFQVQGQQVHVFYDLNGEGVYAVSLRLLGESGSKVVAVPRTISGDVGAGVRPGRGKKIVWKVLEDVDSLEGDDFVFEVRAARRKGTSKWVWVGGLGAAAGAGAAAVLSGGEEKGTIVIDVPDPEE